MPISVTLAGGTVTGELAHPRDCVTIKEGVGYTVPAGKRLFFTGLGSKTLYAGATEPIELTIDGVTELEGGFIGAGSTVVLAGSKWYSPFSGIAAVAMGVFADEGQVVSVASNNSPGGGGRAYGYLSDL